MYEGKQYDIAAAALAREDQKTVSPQPSAGWYETKDICLVSLNCPPDFICRELDTLPETTVSGVIPSNHHKSTIVTRVFVTENPAWETVKSIKSFRFSRSFRFHFWGYAECRVILVDLQGIAVFTNMAASPVKKLFIPG